MTGDLDPLAAVRATAAALDALASGASPAADPALALLSDLRAMINAAVAAMTDPGVRRDATLLDALADGTGTGSPDSDPALGLLHALRATVDGVRVPAATAAPVTSAVPAPLPVRELEPAAAVVALSAGRRRRRRVLRTGVAAGSVALALSMSGVAAAAYDSHPGSSFYGLRTQTFGRTDDDPVAAEEALATAREQIAVALKTPTDTSAAARARAAFRRAQHDIAAEHDPVAQKSIAASASTVETRLAVLPAPVVTHHSRAPHPSPSLLAGRRIAAASERPASPGATSASTGSPVPTASAPRSPEASAGAAASPTPSESAMPSGTPVSPDSPAVSPAPAGSAGSASADPSVATSGDPSPSTADSASPSDSPTAAATPARPVATVRATPVAKATKPKARKKKSVIATLLTAQLPNSGGPQR